MDEPRAVRRARPHNYSAVRLLQKVAVIANEADTFSDAISATLREVCKYAAWPVGHAYLVDNLDPKLLRPIDVWHVPDRRRYRRFVDVSQRTPLRAGVGLPGRVLRASEPAWIHDVQQDDNFLRDADVGVRGAFAVPVLAGRNVVAVLEFFSDHPEPADDLLLELVGYVGTQLGRVAERERAAARLVAQAQQTKHLIESVFDAFIAIDERGRVTSWNRAAETMFGWTADEILGRPLVTRIIPPRRRDAHLDGIRRYVTTHASSILNQRIELIALRKNGEEFPVELAVWPVEQDGRTTFCGIVHDVTHRKAQEQEREVADQRVRTSEQRLAVAQEMAAVGSWDWEIENNTVHWSDQLYRNFGVTPEEFAPSFESYMNLVHPQDRGAVAARIASALDDLGSFDLEHRIVRPSDGAIRIHQCQGRVIVAGGRAVSMAGTNQDVTERKRNEEALKEAYDRERAMVKRLEQLDAARTQFVSAVSHELRTPLTSIIGYLQLVMDMGHEITEEHIEMLDVVDRNSQRLLALIEDLLTKSRLESGKFTLNVASTDVKSLLDGAVRAMLPTAADRNVRITLCAPDDVGTIDADAGQVERIILNLLSNAVKFTDGGEVTVGVERDDECVSIAVSDTGVGIDAEDLPHLFSPFYRTSTAERTAPGTGLGLALVKGIVDAHLGTVDVSSEIGLGTTVVVRLPVVHTPATTAA